MNLPKLMDVVSDNETEIQVNGEVLCRYLDWDSDFFGFRIARVEKPSLNPEDMLTILAWCRHQEIDCLYFLADSSDASTIHLVEAYKFNLVDVRVTLERSVKHEFPELVPRMGFNIRPAREDDLPALRQIAGTSIQFTRFYFDQHFPRHLCTALYKKWIEASFNGLADTILVAEVDAEPAGFITCKLDSPSHGKMGLVGVGLGWQGRGIGIALIDAVLSWFASRHVDRVTVVTQGRNIPAQRLYQRCGFLISANQLWFHRWFDVTS